MKGSPQEIWKVLSWPLYPFLQKLGTPALSQSPAGPHRLSQRPLPPKGGGHLPAPPGASVTHRQFV